MDETKNYQLDLSLLRVMVTILVVFDHAFYIFTYGQLSDLNISEIYPFTFIIKSLFAIVNMPIFVLISGYLFYKKYVYNQVPVSKTSILKKKASRLLLPYLAFAPIVLLSKGQLVSWIYHPLQPIGHLWFLLMLFGVTAIYIPLISFQNSQKNRIFVFLIMLIISIAIPACVAHFDEFSDAWSIVTLNRFGIGGVIRCLSMR
jgi:surface polysaccharide O-acyltransferase-like enzyme